MSSQTPNAAEKLEVYTAKFRIRDSAMFVTIQGCNHKVVTQTEALLKAAPDLLAALREIEAICSESASDCRKRMGTRAGNSLAVARAALASVEAL